jgi:hypothetical protein
VLVALAASAVLVALAESEGSAALEVLAASVARAESALA